jgi:hypothetical protein
MRLQRCFPSIHRLRRSATSPGPVTQTPALLHLLFLAPLRPTRFLHRRYMRWGSRRQDPFSAAPAESAVSVESRESLIELSHLRKSAGTVSCSRRSETSIPHKLLATLMPQSARGFFVYQIVKATSVLHLWAWIPVAV